MTQMSIIFLGTGGSWPTVQRNVTAIAVKRGSEVILFDCGEGTQRQFQKSNLSYMQISNICITHFHGDHFLGLPGLIQTMELNDRKETLHIYGPRGIIELVSKLLTLGYFRPSYEIVAHELKDGEKIEFEEYTISCCSVDHNIPVFAYSLEENMRPGKFNKPKALKLGIPEGPLFSKLQQGQSITLTSGKQIDPDMVLGPPRPGRKIIFSGDTRFCSQLVDFSHHADVLIHEATFDSALENVAFDYGHATARQAAKCAKQANVHMLLLTHISPRYLKTHELVQEARVIFKKSYIPDDLSEFPVHLKK